METTQLEGRELLFAVERLEISINPIPILKLARNAIRAWEQRNNAVWNNQDTGAMPRLMVNYARHNLTRYDRFAKAIGRRAYSPEAIKVLREKVYAKIADTYPQLADECKRQIEIRAA